MGRVHVVKANYGLTGSLYCYFFRQGAHTKTKVDPLLKSHCRSESTYLPPPGHSFFRMCGFMCREP